MSGAVSREAKGLILISCTLLGVVSSAYSARGEVETVQAVRHFVQEFYDWYVPKAFMRSAEQPWRVALEARPTSFSADVTSLLAKQIREQAHTTGEISGIDFDPFLGTQDPEEHYNVGHIVKKGERYWVTIYRVSAQEPQSPTLLAEVANVNGHLEFKNFRYPDGKDLLTLLQLPNR